MNCAILALSLVLCTAALGAPTPEQVAYWWQDELRTVAFGLSVARAGRVSQWPRLTVPAGSATLPLPKATGPVSADGKLDEKAWAEATRFPVGPLFGPWEEGPFTLTVLACRDERRAYLAIESPVDLAGIGAVAAPGALFHAGGKPQVAKGKVAEVAVPLAKGGVAVAFEVELVRRKGGKLPPGLAGLALTGLGGANRRVRRGGSLWLSPIQIRLVPANVAVRLARVRSPGGKPALSAEIAQPGKPPQKSKLPLEGKGGGSVRRYHWQAKPWQLDGFVYVEPLGATVAAARDIIARAADMGSTKLDAKALMAELLAPESWAAEPDPNRRAAWRHLYCRARAIRARAHLNMLDAPLLFTKRHPYYASHIYDDYYTWHPGGGLYVLENPHDPTRGRTVRPAIDPTTKPTLGGGVYRDPELWWDATRLVFAHKGSGGDWTSLYEIGVDGTGLRRLTKPEGYHDITPCYLPDGRIVFTSTRPRGRVPCFNSGVDTLHVMNPDGRGIRSISSNNVTEFDPAVLPDGRILYGRWEYLDKTALYMQSLWTMLPDGTHETSLFANNLARPTAVLDARPVPGTSLIAAALTPHNGQAVGAIGMIDPTLDKNYLPAVTNLTPEYRVEMDQGLHVGPCDPWPLSKDDVLISNNALAGHGIIELIDRFGHRELVHCDPAISCFAPQLVKPRPAPHAPPPAHERQQNGRFLVLDVYQGLDGVKRGEIRRLRVVEETSRVSEVPRGGRWWNQAFLNSWQGAYVVKSFLGTVPVYADGSAYFEAPPGRALYLEALDADGREVHRMRTFVQAVPGTTRTCIGCHEKKMTAPSNATEPVQALLHPPATPQRESWGSGFIDYPTMIQPVLDRHCVKCHGGEAGFSGGHDLTGGWTWAFSISYETLLKNNLVGFVRCNNADVTSSVVLKPRMIGSGAAPLGDLLLSGHKSRIPKLTRPERELIFAWMDGNSNYYGTWDYTPHATCNAILAAAAPLSRAMKAAGCTGCHAANHVGNDWLNLQRPELSRILRAPLAKAEGGLGLAWCRERKAPRGLPLVTQRHLPPDVFRPPKWPKRDPGGKAAVPLASTSDPHYQRMLAIIQQTRAEALSKARVDMPGAQIVWGECRMQVPTPLPAEPPPLHAEVVSDGAVGLSWPRDAQTIGLGFEVHRGTGAGFAPGKDTLLSATKGFQFTDYLAPGGEQHYALVLCSVKQRSAPVRATVTVPPPKPPPAPTRLAASAGPGEVVLRWTPPDAPGLRFNVYRARGGGGLAKLNAEPISAPYYLDPGLAAGVQRRYVVRSVSRRGVEGAPTAPVAAAAKQEEKEPVFVASFAKSLDARFRDDAVLKGRRHGKAEVADGALRLGQTGFVSYPRQPEFDLTGRLSVELWAKFDKAGTMPVLVSYGRWQGEGWFLQRYQGGWRWYVGGANCDGGRPAVGKWIHLVCTYDGRRARVFQDGKQVAEAPCKADRTPWTGDLIVGQYSTPGASFQVEGQIRGLRIYRRAVSASEAEEHFKQGRQ